MMKKFSPVVTARDLVTLDGDEIEKGYYEARKGYVLKGNESRSFTHGWRNGLSDITGEVDKYQHALAADIARVKREAKRK